MPDAGFMGIEELRRRACLELFGDSKPKDADLASCLAIMQGPAPHVRTEGSDDAVGYPAALIWASLFFSIAWAFRGAMGR